MYNTSTCTTNSNVDSYTFRSWYVLEQVNGLEFDLFVKQSVEALCNAADRVYTTRFGWVGGWVRGREVGEGAGDENDNTNGYLQVQLFMHDCFVQLAQAWRAIVEL